MITLCERTLLRDLAQRVAEIAAQPQQEEKRRRWYAHNRLEHGRPMVLCFPEGSWEELLPESVLETTDPLLRQWEHRLRTQIYTAAHFPGDHVVDRAFRVDRVCPTTDWGLQTTYIYSSTRRGAYVWDAPIKEPADLERLHPPQTTCDEQATQQRLAMAQDFLGDILDVELRTSHWWTMGLIGELARLRGLQQIMLDMMDNPEFVHRAMRFLMEGRLQWLQSLEDRNLLSPNYGNDYVGSGGLGFSDELLASGNNGSVRLCDLWGFAEAQEITDVSPAMHDEFVLTYQIPLLERFGLNCYGCCEPLHHKLGILFKVPHLRRISISPWCDVRIAAEKLGDRYIFSWKPNPAHLAAVTFDPDLVRRYIRETLAITRGCIVEMILKDTHTCNHDPQRFDQWMQIACEEVERAVA
ncbi:MAG: hypothetical protein HY320_14270 [Armatimonadetes bacterium]|nr:hypothetical protein [Armatimonadota bacterium]